MKFTQSLLLCGVATVSVVSAPSLQGECNGHLGRSWEKDPAVYRLSSALPSAILLPPSPLYASPLYVDLLHVNPTNVNPPSAKKLYAWVGEIGNGWYLEPKDYDVLTKEIRYMCSFYPDKRFLLNDVRELIKTVLYDRFLNDVRELIETVPYDRFEMSEKDFVSRYLQANAFFVAYADKEFDRYRKTPQGLYDPLREKVSEILDRISKMPLFTYANDRQSRLREIISQGCKDVRELISEFPFKTAPSLANHVCHILKNYESHLLKKEAFFSDESCSVFEHDVVDYDGLFRKFSDLPSDANAISVPIAKKESANSKDRSGSDAFLSTSGTPLYAPTWQKIGAGCYMKSAMVEGLKEFIEYSRNSGRTLKETWEITKKCIAGGIPDNAISNDTHNLYADRETVRKLYAIMDPEYILCDEIEGQMQERTPQRTFRARALKFFREFLVKVYYGDRSACRRADEHF